MFFPAMFLFAQRSLHKGRCSLRCGSCGVLFRLLFSWSKGTALQGPTKDLVRPPPLPRWPFLAIFANELLSETVVGSVDVAGGLHFLVVTFFGPSSSNLDLWKDRKNSICSRCLWSKEQHTLWRMHYAESNLGKDVTPLAWKGVLLPKLDVLGSSAVPSLKDVKWCESILQLPNLPNARQIPSMLGGAPSLFQSWVELSPLLLEAILWTKLDRAGLGARHIAAVAVQHLEVLSAVNFCRDFTELVRQGCGCNSISGVYSCWLRGNGGSIRNDQN